MRAPLLGSSVSASAMPHYRLGSGRDGPSHWYGLRPSRTMAVAGHASCLFAVRFTSRSTLRRHTWLRYQAATTRVHRPRSPETTVPLEDKRRASRTRRKHSRPSKVSKASNRVRFPRAGNHRPRAAASRVRARAGTWVAGRNRARRPRRRSSNPKVPGQTGQVNRRMPTVLKPLTSVHRAMTTKTRTSRQVALFDMPWQAQVISNSG